MNSNKIIKSKYILLTFLKTRFIIILIFLIILLRKLSLNYYYASKITGNPRLVYSYFFNLRGKYEVINNIIRNSLIILDSKFDLLYNSFFLISIFIVSIFLIKLIICHIFKEKKNKTKIIIISIGLWSFIYCLLIGKFSFNLTILITSIILFLYISDFILFNNSRLCFKIKKIINNVLIYGIGIGEFLFTPFYLQLIKSLKDSKTNKKDSFIIKTRSYKFSRASSFIIKNSHFVILIFFTMTLLSPSKFSHVNDTIQLIDKESYGLALSQKSSELFFFLKDNESILSVPLDDQERCFKLVYSEKIPTDNQSISEIIKLSDAREELYLMDFENNLSLKGIDINNYSIKWQIQSGFVNPDDFRMEYSSNFLFIIDDDSKFVYKIDLSMQKIIVKKEMINTDNSEIIYNKDKDVLYLGEWNSRECSGNYFAKYILYEMDGKTLDILRNISVPGPTWDMVVSKDGTKLYCAFPFESFLHSSVYVFDTESFEIIDKIDVPLGTRAIVLDDERQLLFAGSAATNLIDIIDLKTKKTIKTYKAGDYSIREMILDKKRRNFYVSTQHFGVFKGNY